jgi:hypothetical protein
LETTIHAEPSKDGRYHGFRIWIPLRTSTRPSWRPSGSSCPHAGDRTLLPRPHHQHLYQHHLRRFFRHEPEHNNTHCQRPHRDRHAHSRRQRERHRPYFRTGGKLGSHQRSATAKPSSTTERRASSSFRTTSYRTNSAQPRRNRDPRQSHRSRHRMMMTGVLIIHILRHSN